MKPKKALNIILLIIVSVWLTGFNLPGLRAKEKEINIAAVGDLLFTNKISFFKDPQFMQLVEILRRADCTYGNCETTILNDGEGFPAYKDFDSNNYCEPWGADEFKWLGIDLVSLANNHIMDFDCEGMFSTLHNLDRVDIKYAGAGKDLDQAAKPGYFETYLGPVALVSCVSSLPEKNYQASLAHPYMKGRPGHNPINVDFVAQLDPETFDKLVEMWKTILLKLGEQLPPEDTLKDMKKFNFGDNIITKGDKTEVVLTPKQKDLDRMYEMVKIAKRNARIVIVSLHEHVGRENQKNPTKFEEDFARACIDAGADIFIGTGSHEIWGIEIYKGKPLFYSIGNFFFQTTSKNVSAEAYQKFGFPPDTRDSTILKDKFAGYFENIPAWESFVPYITFDGENKLEKIAIYPIDLAEKAPYYRRGTPSLADKDKTKVIMDRLIKISEVYKTKFVFKDNVWQVVL